MSESLFKRVFHDEPEQQFFAPGRVNLIGEHIDYCGGLVMPMAIDRGSRGWARRHDRPELVIYSERFGEQVAVDFGELVQRGDWSDFALGVVSGLQAKYQLAGLKLCVSTNIEAGGLSSSASFSLLIAHALLWAAGISVNTIHEKLDLAKLCQRVEHEFIGVKCGIMDQASVALGGIIELDCETLSHERLPEVPCDYQFVVMDTAHPRTLASSAYNKRVTEVAELLRVLKSYRFVANLCEFDPTELPALTKALADPILVKRLTHIVTEHERVKQARVALLNGDMVAFGHLMNQSHRSLRNDYEVTGPALDSIVDLSRSQPGCVGARMTGAGFGGCAIALVEESAVASHNTMVSREFNQATGVMPNLFCVKTAAGAGAL